jgi:hypothetical protein
MAVTSVRPGTATGVGPCELLGLPQHQTVPSLLSAHTWAVPTLTSVTPASPTTVTGKDELYVPLPNMPLPPAPQHRTRESLVTAHVVKRPAEMRPWNAREGVEPSAESPLAVEGSPANVSAETTMSGMSARVAQRSRVAPRPFGSFDWSRVRWVRHIPERVSAWAVAAVKRTLRELAV